MQDGVPHPFPRDPQLGLGSSGQWHSCTQDLGARAAHEPSGQKGNPVGSWAAGSHTAGSEGRSWLSGPGEQRSAQHSRTEGRRWGARLTGMEAPPHPRWAQGQELIPFIPEMQQPLLPPAVVRGVCRKQKPPAASQLQGLNPDPQLPTRAPGNSFQRLPGDFFLPPCSGLKQGGEPKVEVAEGK